MSAPKLRIEIHEGISVLTSVTLNGEAIQATRVKFDTGESVDGLVKVELELIADLLIIGEAEIVRTWRQMLPWYRRLPYWLRRPA